MKITPTALTITQLLSTQSERFVIPAYQRRYSWQAKHIRELFDDVNQLDSGETHLLGSIVCLTASHGVGVNDLELVDGQQRTTTIMLFLRAIEQRLHQLGQTEEADEAGRCLICKDYTGKRMSKLQPGDLDERDFARIMEGRDLDEVVNRRLLEASQLIAQLIGGLSDDGLALFKYKFLNQASIIRLDVAESKDAFKLFETINNRGLTLSPADIIKNFLLGNASLVDDATLEAVKSDWTKLVVALDGIDMDDFFRQYTIALIGRKVPTSKLIDTFKRYYARHVAEGEMLHGYSEYEEDADEVAAGVSTQHLTDFAADLRKSADVYKRIVLAAFDDAKLDRHMANLRKIRSYASYTFVLDLMRRDIERSAKLDILQMIETFMLRRNVAEYRTNELEDIFARLTKLPDDRLVERAYAVFRDNLPSDEEFRDKLLRHDFKGQLENRAKYMLEQMEYYLTGNTGEKYIAGGEEVHLEHIMPQTITTKKSKEEFGDWELYLGVDAARHGEYVARLGNLTLLAAPLNIHASNNPFKAKQHDGVDEGKGKQTDYSQSNIELTRKLLAHNQWKIPEIEARTQELADVAVRIWSLPHYDVPEPAEVAARKLKGVTVYCGNGKEEVHATGTWDGGDSLTVRKTSTAVAVNRPAFNGHSYSMLKERLLKTGVLVPQGNVLAFTEDYEFDSPSAAAAIVLARAADGPSEWKDADGNTLDDLVMQGVRP